MKDNSKIHILLVDDEKLVRSVMADMLNKNGILVTEASSGSKAVGLFAGRPFDAVLLDMIMKDMDGIATLKELKKINPDIPVIIVTGYGDVPTTVAAIKLGAYDYVEKPVDENRIVLTIQRATEKKCMETKIRELGMAIDNSLNGRLARACHEGSHKRGQQGRSHRLLYCD